MKAKFFLIVTMLWFGLSCKSQMEQYNFKRELIGSENQWQKLIISNEVFQHLTPDFSDLRIFGILPNGDTLEVPYILNIATEKTVEKATDFEILNESKSKIGTYFTFKIPSSHSINQIDLDFAQQNYDWKIMLEGSQNQIEWFNIADDYRIVSIKNQLTTYQFTNLVFPVSQYAFYRILVKSIDKVELKTAKVFLKVTEVGTERKFEIKSFRTENIKESKQTILYADLNSKLPVDKIKLHVNKKFDFYRPLSIETVSDSVQTEKGWVLNYESLASGLLNSIEKNEFQFKSTLLSKTKITINNDDNNPLEIDSISMYGSDFTMIFRITEEGKYYLTYGNSFASKPIYDLQLFTAKIPKELKIPTLGKEEIIEKKAVEKVTPLFENKIILWTVMGVIIMLLGWFSLAMIKKK